MQKLLLCSLFLGNFVVSNHYLNAAPLITYELLPGSTITPINLSDHTLGTAEPITGTFVWTHNSLSDPGLDAVSLSFTSPSFTIVLDHTSETSYETYMSRPSDGNISNFAEVVDISGLDNGLGEVVVNSSGSYTGPQFAPTLVTYPDVEVSIWIGTQGAAYGVAKLSFSARQVPEPSALALAAFGGLALVAFARRRAIQSRA